MLSISFQSHLIRHSATGFTFKDTQRVVEHLKHLENIRVLGHSEGTRALEHLRLLGTQTPGALRHSDT